MGLDMYLNGKRYMSKYFNEEDGARAADITDKFPELQGWKGRDDDSPVKEVKIEAGYWRKANAIHRWFVENCQEGEDDCGTYPVGRADLERLRETCQTVLGFRHLADSQLPTGQGFFFGSSEYNDDYYQDVVDTIEILDRVLALPDSWEFEYQSSW
jgi:hypothetical protein